MFTKAMAAMACAAALAVGSTAGASGPINGSCSGALVAPLGTTTGNNCDAFESTAACPETSAFRLLWYMFTAPSAGVYTIDTLGTQFDTVLLVFDGCGGPLLACDDDTNGLTSAVKVSLGAGQTVKIAVGGFTELAALGGGQCGTFNLNIATGPGAECCRPWDNGRYDNRNGQTSQIGFDRNWTRFARVTADDFWLCEGSVYRIRTVRAVMLTDAIVPKAQVAILGDCNGTPTWPLAVADSQPIDLDTYPVHLRGDCAVGTVEIRDLGTMTTDGFRQIEVTATFPKLWLKGGVYWVAFAGYSGTADPEEQFFWGTSGNNVVKGRPARFFNSDDQSWTDIDLLCCGCTDFNFCLEGESCKILLDNGVPDILLMDFGGPGSTGLTPVVPGSPSLQNGTRTSDKSRTADDFVVPPCNLLALCYVEGYVLTNCDRVRLDIFDGACHCPGEGEPLYTLETQCLTPIGAVTAADPLALRLYRAEFFDFKPIPLRPGHNYWVSLYALGDNSQGARGYFLWNVGCDRRCQINFNPGCVKGPPYVTSTWRPTEPPRDFAFLVAVQGGDDTTVVEPPPACAADFNQRDGVTMQDLFDYLAAWFVGCP